VTNALDRLRDREGGKIEDASAIDRRHGWACFAAQDNVASRLYKYRWLNTTSAWLVSLHDYPLAIGSTFGGGLRRAGRHFMQSASLLIMVWFLFMDQ
jgi:hypothetical protein